MVKLGKIELDLGTYKIIVHFQNDTKPLVLHFEKPSRKFYFSLIALIVNEMKNKGKLGYIHIRKYENTLKQLDNFLAGQNASETTEGMWDKIRKAWRHRLPDLESAVHFKVLNRELIPPYEKGSKYRFKCTDEEGDIWANFFQYDHNNKWKFKFAVDSSSLTLNDISLRFGDLRDNSAWQAFLTNLSSVVELDKKNVKISESSPVKKWFGVGIASAIILIIFLVSIPKLSHKSPHSITASQSKVVEKTSVAVMPFVNVSNDPDKEYFCYGISEEIINSLAKLKDLRVISRTSSFYFKDKNLDIRTIGDKLNVDNILEGSVRISGDKLRIATQLIKVSDDSHLWAEIYDFEVKDIFNVQEELAKEIVCSLKSRLGCQGKDPLIKYYTNNVEAFQLYKKGRYASSTSRWELKKAIDYFKQALELDPNYALAYTGLAHSYKQLAFASFKPNTPYYTKAMKAALTALEIEDMLPEAHYELALLKFLFEWDWKGVERAIKRVMELNPGDALPYILYENYLRAMGRFEEGVEEIKIALRLDPMSSLVNNRYGCALLVSHQFKQAIKQLKATLDIHPNDLGSMIYLGNAYLELGLYDKGVAIMEKALNFTQGANSFILGVVGHAYGQAGMTSKAQEILNKALERSRTDYFSSFAMALIYMGLGNTVKTFEWLEKAYEEHNPGLTWIKAYPQFWDLHDDPRYQALLKKMGLEV